MITIDPIVSVRGSINAENQPDKLTLDSNLFTDSRTFEVKSQVSFNTSRKITQFAALKKKIMTEEKKAESLTKKHLEAQPLENAVDLTRN